MPSISQLRSQLALPPSTKGTAVVNHAIRRFAPGGSEVLDTLTRLHEMQHGRHDRPDPAIQEMLDDLQTARDKMAEWVLGENPINT